MYFRILPKEDLENVHRLLQTPTPRRRRTAGIHVKDSFTSPTADQPGEASKTQIPRDMHDVVPKSLGLETTFKASNFPTSPVCDRRVSNYERILPKEDLENVHRLLQTPTPRRRRTAGIHVKDSFTSPTAD
ncbi:hypothetical protein WUBG_19072, partial [Wuchereria bancrofti]